MDATEIYTLSLHDALPICLPEFAPQPTRPSWGVYWRTLRHLRGSQLGCLVRRRLLGGGDRKSTRLNSSHLGISYAVFCLKKKNFSASSWTLAMSARRSSLP